MPPVLRRSVITAGPFLDHRVYVAHSVSDCSLSTGKVENGVITVIQTRLTILLICRDFNVEYVPGIGCD